MGELKIDSFVFLDARGKRWPRLRKWIFFIGLFFSLAIILFIQSLFVTSQLQLPASVRQLKARLKVLQKQESGSPPKTTNPLWLQYSRGGPGAPKQIYAAQNAVEGAGKNRTREVVLGFYQNWDSRSFESLKLHADQMTHVSSQWLTIADGLGTLVSNPDPQLQAFCASKGIVLMPLLDNLIGDTWQPEAVESLANGPEARQEQFISNLISRLTALKAGGVVIDWEQVDPAYQESVTALVQKMAVALHQHNMELWLSVPMGQDLKVYDLETLAHSADQFIAMLSDETSETDPPGPIASQEWFNGWVESMSDYGTPSQWIIGVGSYGYDWTMDGKKAETISFHDVMTRAGRAGLTDFELDSASGNPHFSYEDEDTEHTVWFLDVATFINEIQNARENMTGGIAISQLGNEDPDIWKALKFIRAPRLKAEMLTDLQPLKPEGIITHVGTGEFITVDDDLSEGARRLTLDADGKVSERYEKFPNYLTLCHMGEGDDDQVAITFDDGPDPKWTPIILDVLKEKGVKAAFFVVGAKVEANPDLAERIVREGHEIGIHTYTHPNLAMVSAERALLEFNATERLIETITGRSTILFRPPYNADSRPQNMDEIVPIKWANALGYLTVMENIDTEDWARPGSDAILQRVKQMRRAGGNIILMHDAGGDRRQTVEALPHIIDYLQARGDRISSLGQVLNESPDFLMPPVQQSSQSVTRFVSGSGFRMLHIVENFLWAFMILATFLIVLRTLIVAFFALENRRSPAQSGEDLFQPRVSIIVAAYNEEKVIKSTLQNLLKTRYPGHFEVIVIDDGSKDRTAEIVAGLAAADSRIRLIRQPNGGKARALRRGINAAANEILVMLDADTHFQPDTVERLVQPFRDETIGAVSGHAKVGNMRTFIARCQSLEYTCGFNLDRRAYHQLNCITVAPGAVSALRRTAILKAGGISTDTLAEDTDLTLSLHRCGFRIAYVPQAIAWTEAPETLRTLAKQRFRWAFGTLQCLWKHRDLVFDTRYKALAWFSLPSIWLFQILLVAVGPLVDAFLIYSMLFGIGESVYVYFLIFLLMDLFLAALACLMEKESLGHAWLIIPMRFIYRPLLSWVIWKSIFRAVQGVWVSWGKLERTASVPNHL
ncbi:MAG: glycosyltransferase [Deltaproteobacteria bacterium]|nr:glycosyltransferase [Deltaproteobacteria bacterium]